MKQRRKCPAIDEECKYYLYIEDNYNDVVLDFCRHSLNDDPYEGNCTKELCPLQSKKVLGMTW